MSSGLINSVNNVQSFISSNSSARPTNSVLHQQSLASSGVLHDKQKDKKLSKNIETVLNKLSSKVSSDKVKSKDSETVADIEQDIGTILSLAKNEGEASSSLLSVPDSLFFNDSEVDDGPCTFKQTAYFGMLIGARITQVLVNFLTNKYSDDPVCVVPFKIQEFGEPFYIDIK